MNIPQDLIPGMDKIIQHIKRVQCENKKLREENLKLLAQVQVQVVPRHERQAKRWKQPRNRFESVPLEKSHSLKVISFD